MSKNKKSKVMHTLNDLASHKGERPAGRVRQKNEQTIIEAARLEFAEKGYEGATMNAIARRASLPRPNVHYYFESKLHLYEDILSGILDLWDDALNDLDASEAPAQSLRRYIERKVAFSRDHPLESKIFAKEVLSGAPRLETYFQRGYHSWFERSLGVFREWIAKGAMDPVDPAHLMFFIWSTTQHYADFETQVRAGLGVKSLGDEDYERATDTLVKIILNGIGARDADSPKSAAVADSVRSVH